jgi:Tol biopolymer transport system component
VQPAQQTDIYASAAGWSPDGKTLFYSLTHFNLKASRLRRSHMFARDIVTGQERELYRLEGKETFGYLDTSPNGRYVAFPSAFPKAMALRIIPTAGGEPRELLRVQRPDYIDPGVVAWTPDGRYVLFGKSSDNTPGKTELWRIPVSGGEPQNLGLDMDEPKNLRVHPDGRQIAFSGIQEMCELWVMENFLPQSEASE